MEFSQKYFIAVLFLYSNIFFACAKEKISEPISTALNIEAPSSCFGYYNSSPESLDGQKLVYLHFHQVPEKDYGNTASLRVLDFRTNKIKKIVEINNVNIHDGAMNCWVDNKHIAYQDGRLSSINLDDTGYLKNKEYDKVSVVDISTLEKKTFDIRGRIGHNSSNGKILVTCMHQRDNRWGLYEVDIESGACRFVCNPKTFEDKVNNSLKVGRNPKYWKLLHAKYSPDGTKVAMRMVIRSKSEKNNGGGNLNQLVIIDLDGQNPYVFGPNLLHFGWYDNDVIYGFAGHETRANLNKGAELLGNFKNEGGGLYLFKIKNNSSECIDKISCFGNHVAISPDKQWLAFENWYREQKVVLKVYQKYSDKDSGIAMSNNFGDRTWNKPGPVHVNPSFSRDGKRLFFTEVVDGRRFQAKWIDLSVLLQQ